MKDLRPLARRDARRAAFRRRYERYINSPRWWRRRERWLTDHLDYAGRPPVCAICDRNWTLADDLHHITYATLGHERHQDLVPMCRTCHEDLHQILDLSKHWRSMTRVTATHQLVALLRQRWTEADAVDVRGRTAGFDEAAGSDG